MRNKKNCATIIAATLFCVAVMISCTHSPQQAIPAVSFTGDIQPILAANCALNGSCHLGANNANDEVNLDSSVAYNTIITKHLVATGNPTASLLYVEISTGIMPKAPYSALSPAQLNTILYWIKQGALNN